MPTLLQKAPSAAKAISYAKPESAKGKSHQKVKQDYKCQLLHSKWIYYEDKASHKTVARAFL